MRILHTKIKKDACSFEPKSPKDLQGLVTIHTSALDRHQLGNEHLTAVQINKEDHKKFMSHVEEK